jgi:hypothetical protein
MHEFGLVFGYRATFCRATFCRGTIFSKVLFRAILFTKHPVTLLEHFLPRVEADHYPNCCSETVQTVYAFSFFLIFKSLKQTRVDVMITIFCDFCQFSAKKNLPPKKQKNVFFTQKPMLRTIFFKN